MTMEHDYVCAHVHPQRGPKRASKVRFAKSAKYASKRVFAEGESKLSSGMDS